MKEFFAATAWEMTPPEPYGAFHIIFLVVGLALSILAAYFLRNSTDRQNKIVMFSTGVFLLLLELYKQLFYYYYIGNGSYQWWIFPFQLCSVPIYLCLIVPFISSKKVCGYIYNFLLAFNLMGGFISFLEPSGLCHSYWTLTLHAFIWHMTLVFIGLYLGASKRAAIKLADYKHTVLFFFMLCLVAFGINCALYDVSNGSVNMFFIGPVTSSIIVFKDIAARYGWYVNAPIYICVVALGAFLFYLPFCKFNQYRIKRAAAHSALSDSKQLEG